MRPVVTMAEFEDAAEVTAPQHPALLLVTAWCSLHRGEIAGLQRRERGRASFPHPGQALHHRDLRGQGGCGSSENSDRRP